MILNRNDIIKQYPWINERNQKFIISADYNGLICASFLSHILNWELVGYYDLESLWICEEDVVNYEEIIWVDLNILPKLGRAIGGHIVSLDNQTPRGFDTSCNPNLLMNLTSNIISYVLMTHSKSIRFQILSLFINNSLFNLVNILLILCKL